MPAIEVFTDGACSGNPGAGGWGVILRYGEIEKRTFRRRRKHHQQPYGTYRRH